VDGQRQWFVVVPFLEENGERQKAVTAMTLQQQKNDSQSEPKKSHLHCDFNTNDEENWVAPEWLSAHSVYPEETDFPVYSGRDVRHLNFKETRMVLSEFGGVDAREVDFSRAELSGSDFENADLRLAIFSDAELVKVNLRSANLRGADLSGADLLMASLVDADLTGARLGGSCLDKTDLKGASFDETTELPFHEEEALRRGMRKTNKLV
jgi:uncharacterized protein YjbI with pentapeptide repeats